VRVAAVEVAVAGLPPQVAGRRLDPTAQQRDQRAQVAVVVRSIAQERLERGERTVEQVDEVEREARLVAREVVAGVVEPRHHLAVGGRVRLVLVARHPLVARRVDEEDREPRTLRRVHLGQPPTVAPRQGAGDGHAARGRVADEVELEQHVGAGAPVGRVQPQHVAAAAGLDCVVVGQPAADRPGAHRRPEVVPLRRDGRDRGAGRQGVGNLDRAHSAILPGPATAFIDDYGVAAASVGVGNRSQAAAWRVTGLTSPL
jgi:hypothetical protein